MINAIDNHIYATARVIVRRTELQTWTAKTPEEKAAEVERLIRDAMTAIECTACDDSKLAKCRDCGGEGGERTVCGECKGKGEVACAECRQ